MLSKVRSGRTNLASWQPFVKSARYHPKNFHRYTQNLPRNLPYFPPEDLWSYSRWFLKSPACFLNFTHKLLNFLQKSSVLFPFQRNLDSEHPTEEPGTSHRSFLIFPQKLCELPKKISLEVLLSVYTIIFWTSSRNLLSWLSYISEFSTEFLSDAFRPSLKRSRNFLQIL